MCYTENRKGEEENANQEKGDRVRIFSPDEGSPVEASKKGDSKVVIQFMQTRKPTNRQIWRETHKIYPNIRVTAIRKIPQPWELPTWTVEYIPVN